MGDVNQFMSSALVTEVWKGFVAKAGMKLGLHETDLTGLDLELVRELYGTLEINDMVSQALVEVAWRRRRTEAYKAAAAAAATTPVVAPAAYALPPSLGAHPAAGAIAGTPTAANGLQLNLVVPAPAADLAAAPAPAAVPHDPTTAHAPTPGAAAGRRAPLPRCGGVVTAGPTGRAALDTWGGGKAGGKGAGAFASAAYRPYAPGAVEGGGKKGMKGGKWGKGGKGTGVDAYGGMFGYNAGGKGGKGWGKGALDDPSAQEEWTCPKCQTDNFASRRACRVCAAPRRIVAQAPSQVGPTTMQNAYSYKGTNVEHLRRGCCWNCGSAEHVKIECPLLDAKSSPTVCPCRFQRGICQLGDIGCPYLGLPVSACLDFLEGHCPNTECTFAHLAPPRCPHIYQKGYCTFGDNCSLAGRPVDECCFATCTRGEECRRRHQYHTVYETDGRVVFIHPTKHKHAEYTGPPGQHFDASAPLA